jgi:2-polyprenyl-3-methyl-5-hydroxy-6-metoxy-1,4-benzoquinol methylase
MSSPTHGDSAGPRIGVLVVAYEAAATLASVLDRIPEDLVGLAHVLVSDDHSHDDTYDQGVAYLRHRRRLPLTLVRQPRNLGYGGNQKYGYRWAIEQGLDVVVLLHGDGQYAPELLGEMVAPIVEGRAEVVMGSRMMEPGRALAGGMPLYKYVGNRILTRYQNAVAGLELSEWHSGYRAFSVPALASIPFEANSDGFDFDTEVLLQLASSGARITEIPIPTYYGDEICHVNGLAYARDVVWDVTRMRLSRMGFGVAAPGTAATAYEWKPGPDSSHARLVDLIARRPPGLLLELGCGDGRLAASARRLGHKVVATDLEPVPGVEARVDHFVPADLDAGLPDEVVELGPFDTVVAADVLEHVRRPGRVLDQLALAAGPDARVLVSVPNFAHWYPRARVAVGRFDYDRRGILDQDHVRFFTRRSFLRLAARHGWVAEHVSATGLPFDVADRGGRGGLADRLRRVVGRADRALVRAWPTLFAYQFLVVLRRR